MVWSRVHCIGKWYTIQPAVHTPHTHHLHYGINTICHAQRRGKVPRQAAHSYQIYQAAAGAFELFLTQLT